MTDESQPDSRVGESGSGEHAPPSSARQSASDAIFTAVDDAIAVFTVERDGSDLTFRFRRNNPAHEAQTGVTDTCRGRTLRALLAERDVAGTVDRFRDCVASREVREFEETLSGLDGTREWQTTLTPVIEDGSVTELVSVSQPVSAQRHRGDRHELFETIIERTDEAVTVVDEDGRVRYANPVAASCADGPRAAVEGTCIEHRLRELTASEADADRTMAAIETALEAGADAPREDESDPFPIAVEIELQYSGEEITVEQLVSPLRIDGALEGAVVIARDVTERIERERTLQSLQCEYETVFENVQDALFLLDVDDDGTIRYQRFNEREAEFTDKSTDDVRGKTPVEVFGTDIGAELAANYRDCLECREPVVYEEELRIDDETTVWQTKLTPIIIDGCVERIVGSGREITARKEREQALEKSRNRLQALFDKSPDAIVVHDAAGEILDTNEQNVDNLGYSHAELTSMNVTDYEVGLDLEEARALWSEMDVGETVMVDGTHERRDGSTYPVEVWISKLEIGDEPRYLALGRDITERVERERELSAERDFLDTIIESLPYPFYVLDIESYTVEYANSRAAVETGDTCYELTHGRDQPCDVGEDAVPCPITEIQQTDDPVTVEHTHLDEDGTERVFEVHANPLTDDEGSLIKLAESNIDITDRITYERRLETQRDNLEVLNQVVRHDIRNDLQLVLAYAETLGAYVEEDGTGYVEQVLSAARDAVEITETARDVTEVMLQSDADRVPVRLRYVLEEVVDDVRSSHERAAVSLEGTIPDLAVLADDMLKSLFRNVLKNAIRHNDTEIPSVTVTATQTADRAMVRVADNGPGIADDRKERIFEEGEKGLESEGTGLGLYLVQTLVDRYGGEVWVEDNDPEGTVVVVTLPLDDDRRS